MSKRKNHLRSQLVQSGSGVNLVRLLVPASDDEQGRRFQQRIDDPPGAGNSANMDLAGRTEYLRAKDDMFAHPDIKQAPWYVVDADDKSAPA